MAVMYPKNQGLYDSATEQDNCGIGFVAHIKGLKSHDIVRRGLEVLERMEHRGAEGADNKTGDGAGIMLQMPHGFFRELVPELPASGTYGSGLVFLPRDKAALKICLSILEKNIQAEGQQIIAWRDVPVDSTQLGEIARGSEPLIRQVFIGGGLEFTADSLERKLYVIRKQSERQVRESGNHIAESYFYIPSLSSRTFVYKGMLMPDQVRKYFLDLGDKRLDSAIALVHSRFSTNTFPAWGLAQPFRMIAHNGEINTVKGNRFWMQTRESLLESPLLGEDIQKILPIIEPGRSDSASFDNTLELLVAAGRSLPHALMMLIPESWNDKNPIPEKLKKFYEYHAALMEPWDGPASIVGCDGRYVGGTLDRNGLRPSRYVVTKDDLIVMGSEVGVQTFAPDNIKEKGRLLPGKLLFVDTQTGRIIPDEEIKAQIVARQPYCDWVDQNRVNFADIPPAYLKEIPLSDSELKNLQLLFGYNREDIEDNLKAMVDEAQESTGSMGTDTPLAVFSDKPQRLFNYFKQVFAQVTNPAIDPIREELVMTLTSFIGSQKNLLSETPEHCRMIKILNPVFSNEELATLEKWNNPNFKVSRLSMLFDITAKDGGLKSALETLCLDVEAQIDAGRNLIILSDKGHNSAHAPIPSLLAIGAVHHHLIRVKKRSRTALILESAEARDVHHFALLFGYGADLVNPYGVWAVLQDLFFKGQLKIKSWQEVENNYQKALKKGLLKVMSKMGISTLRSYRGAQIFEAVGLGKDLIDAYFTGTKSRIGGLGISELTQEVLLQHAQAYQVQPALLDSEGVYSWRKKGERHAWNPETIYLLQWSTRTNDYAKYKEFSRKADELTRKPHFIRGLLDFKKTRAIPLEDVEPLEKIMKRLITGAMSFGSISKEVHEAMAIACNSIGARSNSGEGGENPERFKPRKDGTWARSATKQVASGRFGVTSHYLANADEIQIKLSQGAKPGEGGQLPGHKVNEIIAKTRHSTPGVTLISPPPHHDIYSIEDLAQLIFDLKNANPRAQINVKLVSVSGVGTIAAGVSKAHADTILISGYDGGTGASPQSSIKHAGMPWEIGLSETHQTLVLNDLRGRVRLQVDGQFKTGRDIVMGAMLGAEEFGFGTSALIVLGCVMMRKCHLNTCPVGVATQDPELRKRFNGKPEFLVNYFRFLAWEVREYMASLGMRTFDELVGRADLLEQRQVDHWKARTVDTSLILHVPAEAVKHAVHCVQKQVHKINDILDIQLIKDCQPALMDEKPLRLEYPITNLDRSVGTMLSYEISKKYEGEGLSDKTIQITFNGSAGQSFGAFLAKGVYFRLQGDANDYLGKGLSGGQIVVVPPEEADFKAEENIIIGNTVLYGATSGELYVRGVAGERFGVRNSGAIAVVEGTGDHCAEYMTGGTIIVLGPVGRNFAAGMSGGVAYVYDGTGNFDYFCNKGMVELTPVTNDEDARFIKATMRTHIEKTGSLHALKLLENWETTLSKMVKVMPLEYKRVLEQMKLKKIEEELRQIRSEEGLDDAR